MKTIILQKIVQHGKECYIGKADPRDLVRIAKNIGMSEIQDAQRPLSETKVKDIAKYVDSSEGILPNTITIATKDDRIKVIYDEENQRLYTEIPSDESEFPGYDDAIDVMDGQHRLYSFRSDIRKINDNELFEIGFIMYITPSLAERQAIFITCNEKQDKVNSNLLMFFREQLGLISQAEKEDFDLVNQLSNTYPLKGKIIMSAEKITNGFKANQVIDAFRAARVNSITKKQKPLSMNEKVSVITTYLKAWETVVGFSFTKSSAKTAGPAIKMAGFRYMMFLLKPIWDRAIASHQKFDQNYVETTIKRIITQYGVTYDQFFKCKEHALWFRDRTAIASAANTTIEIINQLDSEDFDPLG